MLPPGVAGPTALPGKPADAPKKNKRGASLLPPPPLLLPLRDPPLTRPPARPPARPRAVVDVDRQCGVINDKGYPCPRSLTCKTHNMSAKRAVPHRSQPYDLLLFEWQKTNKANQHKAELLKLANPAVGAGASGGAGAAAAAAGGAASGAAGGTARTAAAAAAAAAAAGAHGSDASTPLGADPSGGGPGGSGADAPKAKRRRSSGVDALSGGGGALGGAGGASVGALSGPGGFKLPGEGGGGGAGGKKGKKGIVYVGEWDESDDDGADELVDSDEEVEAVLRGLARAEHGRPLFIARGGGAGFAAASLFTGRNTKLARLRGTLRDVFRPAA